MLLSSSCLWIFLSLFLSHPVINWDIFTFLPSPRALEDFLGISTVQWVELAGHKRGNNPSIMKNRVISYSRRSFAPVMNDDGWLRWPNDIRGPWGPKSSWHLSYKWGKNLKNLTQEICPGRGSKTGPCVTGVHDTACSTAVDEHTVVDCAYLDIILYVYVNISGHWRP